MKKTWFEFRALAPATPDAPEVELSIYDEIGIWGVRASDFIAQAKQFAGKKMLCRINSPGGDVFDGLAIYNWLRGQDCAVQIDGLAASIASVIALGGKTVCIAENGFFMVHNPIGMAWGGSDDMRETADILDKIGDQLASTYARETGQPVETCKAWMNDETWFTAEDAVKCGLADQCGPQMSFCASVGRFAKPPSALLGGAAGSTNKPAGKNDNMQNLFKALHAAGIIAKVDLDESAAAQEIVNTFKAIQTDRDNLKATLGGITDKEQTAAVEAAIADGRINPEAKQEWLNKITADPSALNLLNSLSRKSEGNEPLGKKPGTTTRDQILAQYQAITDPGERSRFYAKHREVFVSRL